MIENEIVIIHGKRVNLTDFKDAIEACRTRKWSKEIWKPKNSIRYDPTSGETHEIKNGWDHEHCKICSWNIDDNEYSNIGYVDENDSWICNECYSQFIEKALNK